MSLYKFGNFEIEFDPTDVEFVEKYEIAADYYDTEIKKVPQSGKPSAILKSACEVFFQFFNQLFGENASLKMFEKTYSINLCAKAFRQLIDIMQNYDEIVKEIKTMNKVSASSKYKQKNKK